MFKVVDALGRDAGLNHDDLATVAAAADRFAMRNNIEPRALWLEFQLGEDDDWLCLQNYALAEVFGSYAQFERHYLKWED